MVGTKRPLLSRVRVILGGRSSRSVIGRPGGAPTAVVPASVAGGGGGGDRLEERVVLFLALRQGAAGERLLGFATGPLPSRSHVLGRSAAGGGGVARDGGLPWAAEGVPGPG